MSTEVKFFLAFVVVLALIGVAAWAVRRFGGGALRSSANRGRMPRLAVIDAAPVDNRRRLVLIRRDNVEHLVMIGGPSDVVIEANIARTAAARGPVDVPGRAPGGMGEPSWSDLDAPTRPEPQELPDPHFTPEPPPRAVRPTPPMRPVRPEPRPENMRPPAMDEINHDTFAPEPRMEPRMEPRPPMARARPPEQRPMEPRPAPPRAAEPRPAPAPAAPLSEADQNLAEMAQRLEAALRRPGADPRPAPAGNHAPPVAPDMPPPRRPAAPPRPAEPRPAATPKSEFDSLEDEMANLLGRPKNPS